WKTNARPPSIPAAPAKRKCRRRIASDFGWAFIAAARTNISPWSRAMSAITGCRLIAPNYDGKLWNGRQRAAHARAAWPGNTFRISPDGWGCVYRRMDKEARCGKELSDIRHLNQAPLKYCDGSTGVAPLRISKCNCGEVTLP